jgi:hypothetical protein
VVVLLGSEAVSASGPHVVSVLAVAVSVPLAQWCAALDITLGVGVLALVALA